MDANGRDRTALITGASSGIGLELTRKLLTGGWQVIALIRSEFPEQDLQLGQYRRAGKLRIYHSDLADFASLKHALDRIKDNEDKVDVLFNNAGGSFAELSFSKQGRELHFELQAVVPYTILMELRNLLRNGELKTVINTSSSAFKVLKRFDPDTLEQPTEFRKLVGPYATSKLALSLWTRAVAPALAAEGIRIRSADPGGNNTIKKNQAFHSILFETYHQAVFPSSEPWGFTSLQGRGRAEQSVDWCLSGKR